MSDICRVSVHGRGFLNSKVYMDGFKHENAEDHDETMVMMRTPQRLGRFMDLDTCNDFLEELLRCQADNFNLSRCISSKEQQIAMLNDVRICDEETTQQQESQSEHDSVNIGTSEVEGDAFYSGYSGLPTKMPPAEGLESSHENVDYRREPFHFEAEMFGTYKYNGIGKKRWKRIEHRDRAAVDWRKSSKRFWRNQRMSRLLDEKYQQRREAASSTSSQLEETATTKNRALKRECEDYHDGDSKRHTCEFSFV
ncbi:hypothetical protein Q1695_004867 [Nippostrongylus brasiliensis]|nr:hypothetical protein Q1695_004867 [Nippostrongylus brasiliensis]